MVETTKIIPQEYATKVLNTLKKRFKLDATFTRGKELGMLICHTKCDRTQYHKVIKTIDMVCKPAY